MSWLKQHLDTFVAPQLGFVPRTASSYFTTSEMSVIKSAWRSVKQQAKGKTILLAGRDVFVFEILAQREQYPTVFMPQCSRMTVSKIELDSKQDLFLFDTGFMGSIPRGLGLQEFAMLSYAMAGDVKTQVFPRLTGSRALALKIEATPKYWKTGRVLDGEIVQEFAEKEEFERAAKLTLEVYRDSSPKFIAQHKPIPTYGGFKWTI